MAEQTLQATPVQNIAAIIFIIIILLALWGRFHFEDAAYHVRALAVLDSHASMLINEVNRNIFILDDTGNIHSKTSFDSLGLTGTTTDIQLLDQNRFLIGIEEHKAIYQCNIEEKSCQAVPIGQLKSIANYFMFVYLPSRNDYLVSDTGNHRVFIRNPAKQQERIISSARQFKYPGEIKSLTDGELFITDNNHFSVDKFQYSADKLGSKLTSFTTRTALSDHSYPVDIALSEKKLYITIENIRLSAADIIEYDLPSAEASRISLANDTIPAAITTSGKDLFITVPEQFTILKYDSETKSVAQFSGISLSYALNDAKGEKEIYKLYSMLMLIVVMLTVSGMFILSIKASQQHRQAVTAIESKQENIRNASVPYSGIYWIAPDPSVVRNVRRAVIAVIAIMIALPASMYITFTYTGSNMPQGITTTLLYICGIFSLITFAAFFISVPRLGNKLGTDGKRLYIETDSKQQFSCLPKDIIVSGSAIYTDNQVIMLKMNNGKELFDAKEISTHILPLLNNAQKIPPLSLFIRRLIDGKPGALFTVAALIIIIIMISNPSSWFQF